jgi:2,3-bisphosphoglycerate-independent phosphoglycerate mutase
MPRAFLIILDGFGIAADPSVSAIDKAHLPFYRHLSATWPQSHLTASGEAVGLPEGQFGNSEVGHLNIGAGRIVWQDISRIDVDIRDGGFYQNPAILEAVKSGPGRLHLVGLFSDGGVHSHLRHLYALLDLCTQHQCEVVLHLFGDGRDTDRQAGIGYARELEAYITDRPHIHIGSLIGRYFAMDRDHRWERVQRAYDLMVNGIGTAHPSLTHAFEAAYASGQTDEFIEPIVIGAPSEHRIDSGDTVIFFNFRSDRAREITRALTQADFEAFATKPLGLHFVCMTRYDEQFQGLHIAYPPQNLRNTLGEVVAKQGKTQLRIAETEKYPHVTFFFNGGEETPNVGEKRVMIPSPKVATYDLQPEMSAPELGDALLHELQQEAVPDLIVLNFANPDMVGHTGSLEATQKAVEAVDQQLARIIPEAIRLGYRILIIADHGNADCMMQADGSPHTYHTTAPVPCILVNAREFEGPRNGILADVAPTLLRLMGLAQPEEMTGRSLV